MLKRGNISLLSATVPGLLAYTGLFDAITPTATLLFRALLVFAGVSFLLSLFEDEEMPAIMENPGRAELSPLMINEQDIVRIAP